MTSVEKAHPLASKPICTPQIYDANFQGTVTYKSINVFDILL